MSNKVNFEVMLYSPRWGTEDAYQIELTHKQMIFKRPTTQAVCSWNDGTDPAWSGGSTTYMGNPLLLMLENDYIYPPSIFIRAVESAWKAWRRGELKDKKVETELTQLCSWVNKMSKRKPRTKFWRSVF